MKRLIYDSLLTWKDSTDRKPGISIRLNSRIVIIGIRS